VQAILSDIHANLEALQSVLADAQKQGASEIVCLGDTVGYGPNPVECLELSSVWPIVLSGHTDEAVTCNEPLPGWTATHARNTIYWTRKQLRKTPGALKYWTWLERLPRAVDSSAVRFAHGTPLNPHEYLFPEDIYCHQKMDRIAEQFDQQCFVGHTHLPGLFVQSGEQWEFLSVDECGQRYCTDDRTFICNVGSVGQPRDSDWRASYVLYDGETIRFRRVEYNIQTTVKKIRDLDEFDDFLAERLLEGR